MENDKEFHAFSAILAGICTLAIIVGGICYCYKKIVEDNLFRVSQKQIETSYNPYNCTVYKDIFVATNDAVSFCINTYINYAVTGVLINEVDKPINDGLIIAHTHKNFLEKTKDLSFLEFMENFPEIQNQVSHQLKESLASYGIIIMNVRTDLKPVRSVKAIEWGKPGIDIKMNESIKKLVNENEKITMVITDDSYIVNTTFDNI